MARTRKLGGGESSLGAVLGGEANRQRRAAKREIEGLNQQDQVIALLTSISEQLAWIAGEMHRQAQARSTAPERSKTPATP